MVHNETCVTDLPKVRECRHRKLWHTLVVHPVMHGGAHIVMPECVAKDAREDLTFITGASFVPWDQSGYKFQELMSPSNF